VKFCKHFLCLLDLLVYTGEFQVFFGSWRALINRIQVIVVNGFALRENKSFFFQKRASGSIILWGRPKGDEPKHPNDSRTPFWIFSPYPSPNNTTSEPVLCPRVAPEILLQLLGGKHLDKRFV
jgi:hypothetical protein